MPPAAVLIAVDDDGDAGERAELDVVRAAGRSAARRHIGELPSQQPPETCTIRSPCLGPQALERSSAAGVAVTRFGISRSPAG